MSSARGKRESALREVLSSWAVAWVLASLSLGVLLLLLAYTLIATEPWRSIAKIAGETIVAATTVAMIFEVMLAAHRERALKTLIKNAVRDIMPVRYLNIREHGVVDCFNELDIIKMRQRIEKCYDVDLRVQVIWVPQLDTLRMALLKAIDDRKCRVKILLVDPDTEVDALRARAACLPGYTAERFQNSIRFNLEVLATMKKELRNPLRLQVRLHRGFIAASLYGYGESLLVGLYLNNGHVSSDGLHFKISDTRSSFYRQLSDHFEASWEGAGNNEVLDWERYATGEDDPASPNLT